MANPRENPSTVIRTQPFKSPPETASSSPAPMASPRRYFAAVSPVPSSAHWKTSSFLRNRARAWAGSIRPFFKSSPAPMASPRRYFAAVSPVPSSAHWKTSSFLRNRARAWAGSIRPFFKVPAWSPGRSTRIFVSSGVSSGTRYTLSPKVRNRLPSRRRSGSRTFSLRKRAASISSP